MTPSEKCYDLIRRFEGCFLEAYLDPEGIPTIGWGDTGPGIKIGTTWTQDLADEMLRKRVSEAGRYVSFAVTAPLSQNQFDALTDFVYNAGSGNLASSHLLQYVNAGKFDLAALEFPKWDHGGGKVLLGLKARREAEAELFLTPTTT